MVGSGLHAFLGRRVVVEVLPQIIGTAERDVPNSLRTQLPRVIVAATSTNAIISLARINATPSSSMGGPVLVFAKPHDVRVAIGPVVAPLKQCGGGWPVGNDHAMTTPPAVKVLPCVRGTGGNFSSLAAF